MNHSLTQLVTTWNQEMIAHLKIIFSYSQAAQCTLHALCTVYYVLCTMHALCTMLLLNFFQSNVRTDRYTDRLCVVTICAQGYFTKTPFLEIHVAQSLFLVLPPNLKLWPNLILSDFPIVTDMGGWGGEGDTFGKNTFSDISLYWPQDQESTLCNMTFQKLIFVKCS